MPKSESHMAIVIAVAVVISNDGTSESRQFGNGAQLMESIDRKLDVLDFFQVERDQGDIQWIESEIALEPMPRAHVGGLDVQMPRDRTAYDVG